MARNDNDRNRGELVLRRIDPTEIGLPREPITRIEDARDALGLAAAAGVNLLAPVTELTHLPPDHQVSFALVAFDTGGQWSMKSNGTWYELEGGGKLALHRNALNQLASAAGLSAVPEHCVVEQVGTYHWRARHCYRGKGIDGVERTEVGSVDFDVSDGTPEARKAGRGLDTVRRYGARHAETKAMNRTIRTFLALKGGYTREEAERPFLIPRVFWVPDTSDPFIRRLVAAKELGLTAELFGAEARAQLEADAALKPAPAQLEARDAITAEEGRGGSVRRVTSDDGQAEFDSDPQPDWTRGSRPPKDGPPPCVTCGLPLSTRRANYSIDTYGDAYCDDHEPQRDRRGR